MFGGFSPLHSFLSLSERTPSSGSVGLVAIPAPNALGVLDCSVMVQLPFSCEAQ